MINILYMQHSLSPFVLSEHKVKKLDFYFSSFISIDSLTIKLYGFLLTINSYPLDGFNKREIEVNTSKTNH